MAKETVALLSAGTKISWAVSDTETQPTGSYTRLTEATSIGAIGNDAPNMLDVTRLSSMEYTEKIAGLKDITNDWTIGFNHTQKAQDDWEALVTAAAGKNAFLCVELPEISKAFYVMGTPIPLGLGEVTANAALSLSAHFAPTKIIGYATKPTA